LILMLVVSSWAEIAIDPIINITPETPLQRIASGPLQRARRQTTCGNAPPAPPAWASPLIDVHNNYRTKEPASNQLKVAWSGELAALAQNWADQCIFSHNPGTDCANNAVGENLFIEGNLATYPTFDSNIVVGSWMGERNYYDFANGLCMTGKSCGHYTQLVNARTSLVGCAAKQCPKMTIAGGTWTNVLFVVCRYSPAGNIANQPVYLPGAPCSNCDSDATGAGYLCAGNLCAMCTPQAQGPACKCGTAL